MSFRHRLRTLTLLRLVQASRSLNTEIVNWLSQLNLVKASSSLVRLSLRRTTMRVRTIHQGFLARFASSLSMHSICWLRLCKRKKLKTSRTLIHAMTKEKDWIKWKFDKDVH